MLDFLAPLSSSLFSPALSVAAPAIEAAVPAVTQYAPTAALDEEGASAMYGQMYGVDAQQCVPNPAFPALTDEDRTNLKLDLEDFKKANPDASEADISAYRINQCYQMKGDLPDPNQKLENLDTPEGRLKALSLVTQDSIAGTADGTAQDRCGPASLVASTLYAEGPDGLRNLIGIMQKQGLSKADALMMGDLQKKLEPGSNYQLSIADVQMMQESLYSSMRQTMSKKRGFDPASTGIDDNTMQEFIKNNQSVREMYEKHGMQINFIDTDGTAGANGPNHFVVKMKDQDGNPIIYDPQHRRGGQIIECDAGVEHYDNATKRVLGP